MTGETSLHPTSLVLGAAGLALLAAAGLYNEVVLGLLDPSPPLAPDTVRGVRLAQTVWAGAGLALLGLAAACRRVGPLRRATGGEWAARGTLAVLAAAVPLLLLELALRPWFDAPQTTTLFIRDPALGWRHRPGVTTQWEGVVVRINGRGLRGPEVPYGRRPGTLRILWLGDSVTFGDKLEDEADTFPFLAATLIERGDALAVETVNAAVSGYSPWQYLESLRSEGVRYRPDVVVIGFVPNDVTELLDLTRFGGTWEGWQLWYARSPLHQALERSALIRAGKALLARFRFGRDVPAAASGREVLSVRALVEAPDRPDVQAAWDRAVSDLAAIVALARAHGAEPVLVALPFAFQVTEPQLPATPQDILRAFAERHRVPYLDLLPVLRARAAAGGDAGRLFLDHVHLTVHGNRVVAEEIAAFLARSGVARPRGGQGTERM